MTAAGMAINEESNLSSMPPWPGRRLPLSLTPRVRLSNDSTKSPKVPNTTTTKPNPIQTGTESVPNSLLYNQPTTPATMSTKMHPPIEPSQLFPGETRGNSLCLPISEPTQYAPVSFNQRNTKMLNGSTQSYVMPCAVLLNANRLMVEKGRATYICESIVYAQLLMGLGALLNNSQMMRYKMIKR